MIALVIVAILSALAFPAYQGQMRKNRRADGQRILLEVMQAQEKFFSRNSTYTTDLIAGLGFNDAGGGTVLSENGFYVVSVQACPTFAIGQCVELTATAQGPQVVDGNLTYNSRNEKTPVANW